VSKMIIFTDLDGTLLNHKSYDYKAVLPLLERLKSLDIPVVLNSSKTDVGYQSGNLLRKPLTTNVSKKRVSSHLSSRWWFSANHYCR